MLLQRGAFRSGGRRDEIRGGLRGDRDEHHDVRDGGGRDGEGRGGHPTK